MIRHCTREDWAGMERLLPEAGPCGRTYDDLDHSTVCPHDELAPTLNYEEMKTVLGSDHNNEPPTLQRQLFDECEASEWDPDKANTFGEEVAHLHEELTEAFKDWRVHKDTQVRWTCVKCGRSALALDATVRHAETGHHYSPEGMDCRGEFKPTGVPVEFADVLIGLFYNAELHGFDLMAALDVKREWNRRRNYQREGRALHPADDGRQETKT